MRLRLTMETEVDPLFLPYAHRLAENRDSVTLVEADALGEALGVRPGAIRFHGPLVAAEATSPEPKGTTS